MVEIDANVYSVPWRLIGKTAHATVIGGERAHPPSGWPPPGGSGVIAPTPVSEGLILPHAEALIARRRRARRLKPQHCGPSPISSPSAAIGRPCLLGHRVAILRGFGAISSACQGGIVDQAVLDRYAKRLRNSPRRPVVVAHLLEVVFDLNAYRPDLPSAGLRFEPWPGRVRSHVAGYRFVAGEKRTPRMPECVIAPLRAWSLKYVTLFAPDILVAARNGFVRLEERQAALVAAVAAIPTDAGAPGARPISMIADARAVTTARNGVVREDRGRPSLRGRARRGTGLEVELWLRS